MQPGHVVPVAVGLGGRGGADEVVHRAAVRPPRGVGAERLLPRRGVLRCGVEVVERGVREEDAAAEADGRAAVVLAVAVVDGVLRDHQPGGEHQMVDAGGVGVAGDHVAPDGEAVELALPLLGVELDLVLGPALDPAAHLLDTGGVGLRDGVVVEAGDDRAFGGGDREYLVRFGCRVRVRCRCRA